ncbi:MAG TPA: hypothetical protein VLU47_00670, partial [Blastocatellia bacterium]|nr:hypothetical protein [Blastocatellia bacterium]
MKELSPLPSTRRSFLLFLCLTSLVILVPRPSIVGTHSNSAPVISISFCDAPTVVPNNTGLPNYSPALCFDYSGLQPGLYTLKAYLLQWNTDPMMPPCGSNQWCGDGPTAAPPAVFPIDNSAGTNSAGRIVEVRTMGTFLEFPFTSFMWVIDLHNQSGAIVSSATQPASATMNKPPVLNPI